MESIENKEVKGVSLKLFVTLIVSSVTITASVVGSYFSLVSHMDQNKLELTIQIDEERHRSEMTTLQMKEMRIRLEALEIKVDRMREINGSMSK